jgi:transaldolase
MLKDNKMKIKIYSDGANINEMIEAYNNKTVQGFTTNPTLMSKAGIKDYKGFAIDVLNNIKDMPISFEVFSDTFDEMYKQAKILNSLGDNVYVKIPIMNTKGKPSYKLINKLDSEKVKLNITAVFTTNQVSRILKNVDGTTSHIISIFAGRIADTGIDPTPIMKKSLKKIKSHSQLLQLLWASPREVLNIYQADKIGCDIITVTPSTLDKLSLSNKDLNEFSRETVEMFYNDALKSGFSL